MENPWESITSEKFVLDMDKKAVETYNSIATKNLLSVVDYPEPFIGDPNAPFYILLGNPGRDIKNEKTNIFDIRHKNLESIIFKNLNHSNTKYPFYYLDPDFEFHSGYKWWRETFKNLQSETKASYDNISKNFFCVELYGYHSTNRDDRLVFGNRNIGAIPSNQYSCYLVKKAIKNKKLILLARAVSTWYSIIPELKEYDNCHLLASNRGILLSQTTISPVAFKKIESILAE